MPESELLFRLADQLDDEAALARDRGARLARAATTVRWRSVAADLFRSRAAASAAGMRRSAAGLEYAAEALRRHARNVRRLEELAELATKAAGAVVDGLVSVGTHVLGLRLP